MNAVRTELLYGGAVVRLVLDRPKANLIDLEMILALGAALGELTGRPNLRQVVFEGAGAHFSFGASVAEHLPGQVEQMLPAFHSLFRALEALGVPTVALVRGQCLGGGAELALWCGQLYCDSSAHIGVPEIRLGVFPPIAALALRWRTGGAVATRLVLRGEIVSGEDAAKLGLADACVPDPEAAWREDYESNLASLSPVAVRCAWRACRRPLQRALDEDLPAIEAIYLEELMAHPDATEGMNAFLQKRPPVWSST